MVFGFVFINVFNLVLIFFCSVDFILNIFLWVCGFGGVVMLFFVDFFKVVFNGFEFVLEFVKVEGCEIVVIVFILICYEFEFFFVYYDLFQQFDNVGGDDIIELGYGGCMVGGIFKSLEDLILFKWIVVVLVFSVVFNGYFFNVVRWGIKDFNVLIYFIDFKELVDVQRFNDIEFVIFFLGEYICILLMFVFLILFIFVLMDDEVEFFKEFGLEF